MKDSPLVIKAIPQMHPAAFSVGMDSKEYVSLEFSKGHDSLILSVVNNRQGCLICKRLNHDDLKKLLVLIDSVCKDIKWSKSARELLDKIFGRNLESHDDSEPKD